MSKNEYFLYNNGGAESPLAMIKILNHALKAKQLQQQQQQSQQVQKPAINPHRPVSMYNATSNKQKNTSLQQPAAPIISCKSVKPVVKSTAHTSIQKLVKLDTELLSPPRMASSSSASNYLIKYPVQAPAQQNEANIYDEIDYSHAPVVTPSAPSSGGGTKMRLRNLSSKINCCFRSAQAQAIAAATGSRRRRDPRSVSNSTRHLNSSGSSSSSGVSLASSAISSPDSEQPAMRGSLRTPAAAPVISNRSPVLSSGYNSSQEMSASASNSSFHAPNHTTSIHLYCNQNATPVFTGALKSAPKMGTLSSSASSSKRGSHRDSQIESLKRLQELELLKFNQKQAKLRLSHPQSDSDEYNYESVLARQLDKSSMTNMDSGISTLGATGPRVTDVDSSRSTASDATSNLSTYLSSSPLFSSASSASGDSSASLAHWSPFPKVKTCLIAQVRPLKQASRQTALATAHYTNDDEPIYENLNKYDALSAPKQSKKVSQSKPKQYSLKDVFSSLKSLERDVESEEDLLCDQEVDFYLNRHNFAQYFNFSSYVNSQLNSSGKMNNSSSCKSSLSKCSSRPVALWEQLV